MQCYLALLQLHHSETQGLGEHIAEEAIRMNGLRRRVERFIGSILHCLKTPGSWRRRLNASSLLHLLLELQSLVVEPDREENCMSNIVEAFPTCRPLQSFQGGCIHRAACNVVRH